jgi:hypothetical protein
MVNSAAPRLQWQEVSAPNNSTGVRDIMGAASLFDRAIQGFTDIADRRMDKNTVEALAKIRAADPTGLRTDIAAQAYQDTVDNAGGNLNLDKLQTGYDTLATRMQNNLNQFQDRNMKAQEMSNAEDARQADLGVKLGELGINQKRLENEQELKRIQAAESAQRMRYMIEDHQRNKDAYDANLALGTIASGKNAYEKSLIGDLPIPIGNDKTATLSADDHNLLLTDPSKLPDIATKLGITSAQLQDSIDAAKVDRIGKLKDYVSYSIDHGGYNPIVSQNLYNSLNSTFTNPAVKVPHTAEEVLALNNNQITSGRDSIVNVINSKFKDRSGDALAITRGKDGNYAFTVDPGTFQQVTGMSINDPRAAERVKALTDFANTLGADSNYLGTLRNINAPDLPSLLAQQNLARQEKVANEKQERSANLAAELAAKTSHVMSPEEIGNYFDNASKEFGSHIEAVNGSKIAAHALQNIAADPSLAGIVNEKFVDDFKQKLANYGVYENRKGKIFSIDRDYRDIYEALADTLAENNVIDAKTADKMKEKTGHNRGYLPGIADLDQEGVASNENMADAAKKLYDTLKEYQKGRTSPASNLTFGGRIANRTFLPQ